MAKNSFVIYHNYRDTLEDLTDEQVGQLFRAIFNYEIDRTEPKFSGVLNVAFKFIKKDLDINLTKYENICNRNRKNGQNGGAPVGNQNARKQPKQPKQPDNDNDNDNDNEYDNVYEDDNDNILVSKKERKEENNNINDIINTHARENYDEIFESFCVEPILKDVLIEFIRHCQMNKRMVTNDKLKNIIIHLDMAHKDVYEKVKSVQNAISGGYFDVIESKR